METLFIKNMVCNRCIMVVGQEIQKLDLHPSEIRLGEVVFEKELDKEQRQQISASRRNSFAW